jgi:hypothetical protein
MDCWIYDRLARAIRQCLDRRLHRRRLVAFGYLCSAGSDNFCGVGDITEIAAKGRKLALGAWDRHGFLHGHGWSSLPLLPSYRNPAAQAFANCDRYQSARANLSAFGCRDP